MNRAKASFGSDYFERLYADKADPWNLSTSLYEYSKYKATIGALQGRRFQRALEVGCSIGVLTEQLASLCDSLLAVDISRTAIRQAHKRCAKYQHISLRRMQVPREWPLGPFDLIVLSEVLYFMCPDDIVRSAALSISSLAVKGLILLVNWTGGTDYPCTGDDAVGHYLAACGDALVPLTQRREPQYRLDLLIRS